MAVSINNYKPNYSDLGISINANANPQGFVDELADIAIQVAKEKTKEGIDAFITDFLNSDRTILIEPFDDAKWYYGLEGNTFVEMDYAYLHIIMAQKNIWQWFIVEVNGKKVKELNQENGLL